jgi:TRAP-type uncharacterized transport system substrate-binding protein
VTGYLNTLDYQFIVDKTITRPDQLKGKAVAVSQPGSSSDFAMRYALDKYGLEAGKDVTLVEIGSQPARFAALQSGKIQGVMIAVPLTLTAKRWLITCWPISRCWGSNTSIPQWQPPET